MIVPHDFRVV